MNPAGAPADAPAAQRRRQRATAARRLLAAAPDAAARLDWHTLDRAPTWLGLADEAFGTFQCRVGAVLCAPALRLWIDGARLAAARAVLGDAFLQTLRAEPAAASIPIGLVAYPRIDTAERVGVELQSIGAAVLLASLPPGPLREAAEAAVAPVVASTMVPGLAQALVARTQELAMTRSGAA